MDESLLIRWLALTFLMVASGFFSGTEVALFSLTRFQIDQLKETGGRQGSQVAALLSNPQRLLVTIYIGNELVNVALSTVITVIALEVFGDIGLAVAIGAGTLALLVFGEITPKTFAHHHNEKWALWSALPLSIFMWVIYPIQKLVTFIAQKIAMIFGAGGGAETLMFTEEEIKSLMEEGADEGVIDEEEKEMIHGVFELGDVSIAEVMTPRTDILALEVDTDLKHAWDEMIKSCFARAPVYRETIDNIEGVLYKKDLLKFNYPPPPDVKLASIIHEPFIVPETMTISDLLRGFKKRKVHMAIAMDEYGGTQGVVTMDDIIAEFVGVGRGDRQENGSGVARLAVDTFRIPASLELAEFNKRFSADLSHEEIETIGGYVFHLFGEAPEWGDSVEKNGLKFTVEGLKGSRITELKLKVDRDHGKKEKGGN